MMNRETIYNLITKLPRYYTYDDVVIFYDGTIKCQITKNLSGRRNNNAIPIHMRIINHYNTIRKIDNYITIHHNPHLFTIFANGIELIFDYDSRKYKNIHSFFTVPVKLCNQSELTVILNTAEMAKETFTMKNYWQYDCRMLYS